MPHREDVMLEDVDLFADSPGRSRARGRAAAASRSPTCETGAESHRIDFPEADLRRRPRRTTPSSTRRRSASPTSRWSRRRRVYDYDIATSERDAAQARPRSSAATIRRRYAVGAHLRDAPATARRCPISLVYRKGAQPRRQAPRCCSTATAPTASLPHVGFDSQPLSACSTAAWSTPSRTSAAAATWARSGTTQGRMMNKKNTFTDFIAVRRAPDRAELHAPKDRARHRGRQRRRAAHGRGDEHAARPLQGRGGARALRRRDQHHARRVAAAHRRRVRGVGQSRSKKPSTTT